MQKKNTILSRNLLRSLEHLFFALKIKKTAKIPVLLEFKLKSFVEYGDELLANMENLE